MKNACALPAALERATAYLVEHPEDAWKRLAATDPDTLDNELNRRAWRDTLPLLARRPAELDAPHHEAFAAFMLERGLIETVVPVSSHAFVPR